jgi:hypothetical protein
MSSHLLTIKSTKTLNGLSFNEKVNIVMLDKLLKSNLLLLDEFKNETEKEHLLKYKNLINHNKATVKYVKPKGMTFGRVNPSKSLGLHCFRKLVRHALCKEHYVDVDIVNCHPELLYQIFKIASLDSIKYETLEKYIRNREFYFNTISTNYKINKDIVKELFIRIIFGGSYEYWLKDNRLVDLNDDMTSFIKLFTTEITQMKDIIYIQNPNIVSEVQHSKELKQKENYNIKSSVMGVFLQEYENKVLSVMYEYCIEKDYIKDSVVLCNDGIMIDKDLFKDELLHNLEKRIKDKLNFELKLKVKEMGTEYCDIIDKHIKDDKIEIPSNDMSYEKVKKEFELTHFKVKNPICFMEESTIEGVKVMFSKRKGDFIDTFLNMKHKEFNEKKNCYEKKDFINKWIRDEDMRTYDKCDFRPMVHCEENIYNTFKGYRIQQKYPEELSKKDVKIKFEKSLIFKHIQNLCGNDELSIKYFLHWLSSRIKKPYYHKNQTALIFKSEEGAGKDIFFNWFGRKVIGDEYYISESKTNEIFGDRNGLLENKILTIINETELGKTYNIGEVMKDSITREQNSIHSSYGIPFQQTNNNGYVFLTNNDFMMVISKTDRRFVIFMCNNTICNNYDYFTKLSKEFDNDEYARLFYNYLMFNDEIDIDTFDFVNQRPISELYKDVQESFKNTMVSFLEDLIITRGNVSKTEIIKSNTLFDMLIHFVECNKYKYDINITKFGLLIKKYEGIVKKRKTTGILYEIDYKVLTDYLISKKLIEPFEDRNEVVLGGNVIKNKNVVKKKTQIEGIVIKTDIDNLFSDIPKSNNSDEESTFSDEGIEE